MSEFHGESVCLICHARHSRAVLNILVSSDFSTFRLKTFKFNDVNRDDAAISLVPSRQHERVLVAANFLNRKRHLKLLYFHI